MKKLINDVGTVVPDALRGFASLNPGVALLAGHDIVLRADSDAVAARGEVALIAGGGAGHEPAHAGYVGPGLLTGAVSGDIFSSPSTDAVLAGIRAVAGPAGVLLIVKNYTGDRLNFGLAAEIARAEGIATEMVVVADDVALAANGDHAGRRGIAGTVLVHKIAGAAAAAGLPLADVKAAALRAIGRVATMGVALSPCTVPAAGRPGFELGVDEIELGLGIHGEAGVRRSAMAPAADLVRQLIGPIVADLALAAGDRVAVLINNLGATPTVELQIVAGEALSALAEHRLVVERAWCGTFLTALEMAGVSLSVMAVGDDELAALDAPADAPAWPPAPAGRLPREPRIVGAAGIARAAGPGADADAGRTGSDSGSSAGNQAGQAEGDSPLRRAVRRACRSLLDAEPELTQLDRIVGDGDLGISLARGARAVLDAVDRLPRAEAAALRALSGITRRAVGGTSGPLYSIALLRAAAALELGVAQQGRGADAVAATQSLADAMRAACDAIAEIGGAAEGDCTMMDALWPAARAISAAAAGQADPAAALESAAAAARDGCAATAGYTARRGRSSYLGDRVRGHVDPGARAVAIWMAAAAGAMRD